MSRAMVITGPNCTVLADVDWAWWPDPDTATVTIRVAEHSEEYQPQSEWNYCFTEWKRLSPVSSNSNSGIGNKIYRNFNGWFALELFSINLPHLTANTGQRSMSVLSAHNTRTSKTVSTTSYRFHCFPNIRNRGVWGGDPDIMIITKWHHLNIASNYLVQDPDRMRHVTWQGPRRSWHVTCDIVTPGSSSP